MLSISPTITNFNNQISYPSIVGKITTTQPSKPKRRKPTLKLHSCDVAYLMVIRFFQLHAKNRKCHLQKWQWAEFLIKFGGKVLSADHRKKKRQKLESLGYLISAYPHGTRNAEKIAYITNEGLSALTEYELSYTQRGRRSYTQTQKNNPAINKKQPGNVQKTTRPLSHRSLVKIVNDHEGTTLSKKRPDRQEPPPLLSTLLALGVYPGKARKILAQHGEGEIRVAYQAAMRNGKNPGGYLVKTLSNSLKQPMKDPHDAYKLEEKARREKQAEYKGGFVKRVEGGVGIKDLVAALLNDLNNSNRSDNYAK